MIRSIFSTATVSALTDTPSAGAGSRNRLARRLLIAAPAAALALTGSLITAGPASALDGLHISGTWNVRNIPSDNPNGTVVRNGEVVTVDCQSDGPNVTVAGFGTSAIWDHILNRGYISDLAVVETTYAKHDPRIPPCGTPSPTPPATGDAIVGLAGKCVDVRGAQTSNGTPVQLYDCNNSNAQKWTWSGSTLRALGKCLDITGGGTANGTRIQLWDCNSTGAQTWQTTGQALRNPQSGRCLDVPNANPANGNQLIIWDCHGGSNQTWKIGSNPAPSPSGYGAEIVAQAKSYALGSAGGQCRVWAGNVVNAVLARHGKPQTGGYGSPGGDYWGAYANAGGTRVSAGQAAPGDLIQLNNPSDRNSDTYYTGMHTAIIIATTATPGTFVVRDSNWNLNPVVQEHTWNPDTTARQPGLEANYWRFGTT